MWAVLAMPSERLPRPGQGTPPSPPHLDSHGRGQWVGCIQPPRPGGGGGGEEVDPCSPYGAKGWKERSPRHPHTKGAAFHPFWVGARARRKAQASVLADRLV